MKKLLAVGLSALLSMSFVACSGDSSETSTSTNSEPSQETISISIFSGSVPANTPLGESISIMADYINENSNGTIKATAYYDTELGDATSMVQGLQQGTIDIGVTGTSYFSGLVPEISVFELPFLFSNLEEARAAVDGEAANMLYEKFEGKGMIGLSFWENGFRQLTNNVKPINTPADLEGIKIRTLPANIQVAAWEALGALPTSIDVAELYTALQQGTVSAEENPLHEIVSRKFYEVQNHITLTSHVYTPFFMAVSEKTWDKLSDEQKELIKEASEIGKASIRTLSEEATADAKQVLLDNGCIINETPDIESFKEIAVTVWPVFTDEYGTEILDVIQGE